jgi:hypothetical protein
MRSTLTASALAGALLLAAGSAWADRIALLPSRGGTDGGPRAALDADLTMGLNALGHTLVPFAETAAAVAAGVPDGVADSAAEFRAVAAATKADWVVVASVDPAVTSERVEIYAYLAHAGRVESVAREVTQARSSAEVQEMLAVVVRAEGIGVGELPWERAAPRPPAPAPVPAPAPAPAPPPVVVTPPPPSPPAAPAGPPFVQTTYLFEQKDVWPPYGQVRGFVTAMQGFSVAAARPSAAVGGGGAMVGLARGGYAFGQSGLEAFGEIGGNLFGPPAMWLGAGARLLRSPTQHRDPDGVLRAGAFYVGPELSLGAFFRFPGPSVTSPEGVTYSTGGSANATLAASLDLLLAATPSLALEAQIGNLRWIPGSDGSILLFGATLGAGYRF